MAATAHLGLDAVLSEVRRLQPLPSAQEAGIRLKHLRSKNCIEAPKKQALKKQALH